MFEAKGTAGPESGQFNTEGGVGNRDPAQRRVGCQRPSNRSYVFEALEPRGDGGERRALVVC
jgi:hypothetical protein